MFDLETELSCKTGFRKFQGQCEDINECTKYGGFCRGEVHCTNTVGSYSCGCRFGYKADEIGCTDINECNNEKEYAVIRSEVLQKRFRFSCFFFAGKNSLSLNLHKLNIQSNQFSG